MAKVTITIQDAEDDKVEADVTFDPSLKRDGNGDLPDNLTPAQTDAFKMLGSIFTLDDLTGIE